jgi:hypothetical protein
MLRVVTGNRPTRAVLASAVLLLAWSSLAGAAMKVRTRADPDFDFRPVRTWAWPAAGPGAVRMLRTADDDDEAVRQQLEPTIVEAVAEELGRRRLVPATAGPPDVTVTYLLLVTIGASAQQAGQFLAPVPAWGLPPFPAATTSFSVVEQGSLVIDITAPALERVVWRGIAESKIDSVRTAEQRKARLREAVHDLLRRFP